MGLCALVRDGKNPFPNQVLPAKRRGSRGVAQPGSATVLGTVGRKFESCRPDQVFEVQNTVWREQVVSTV